MNLMLAVGDVSCQCGSTRSHWLETAEDKQGSEDIYTSAGLRTDGLFFCVWECVLVSERIGAVL